MDKPTITYEGFAKLDSRIGTILECSEVENSIKLLSLTIDLRSLGKRTILSGIKKHFPAVEMVGKQLVS